MKKIYKIEQCTCNKCKKLIYKRFIGDSDFDAEKKLNEMVPRCDESETVDSKYINDANSLKAKYVEVFQKGIGIDQFCKTCAQKIIDTLINYPSSYGVCRVSMVFHNVDCFESEVLEDPKNNG